MIPLHDLNASSLRGPAPGTPASQTMGLGIPMIQVFHLLGFGLGALLRAVQAIEDLGTTADQK